MVAHAQGAVCIVKVVTVLQQLDTVVKVVNQDMISQRIQCVTHVSNISFCKMFVLFVRFFVFDLTPFVFNTNSYSVLVFLS